MTGNETAKKVLKELLALSPEELQKKVEENSGSEHWITGALEEIGYFDKLAEEKRKTLRNSQVIALICSQILGTTLIAASWLSPLDTMRFWGFLVAISIWSVFLLGTLFDYTEKKNGKN